MTDSFLWQKEPVNIYIPHEHTKEHQGTWEISPWLPLGRHHQKVKSLQHLQQQNCFHAWDSRSLTDVSRSFAWEREMSQGHNGCWKSMPWGFHYLKCQKIKKAFGQLLLFLAEVADTNLIVKNGCSQAPEPATGNTSRILQCRIERALL